MSRKSRSLAVPATVATSIALFGALGGTGYAATSASAPVATPATSAQLSKQVTKEIQQIVRRIAPALSVHAADIARFASFAQNAGHATTADNATHATNADNATNATTAKNAVSLGGQPASAYQLIASAVAHATNADNATHATNADNATNATTAGNALNLGGQPASAYQLAGKVFTSGGDQVIPADGQAHVLGTVGQFTFTATCTATPGSSAQNVVDNTQVQHKLEFDVVDKSNVADLDGNQAVPAGTPQNVMTIFDNSSQPGGIATGSVGPDGFNQTPSASSSTEIAARSASSSVVDDVDVFYTIALNPLGSNTPECVAGYTGLES